MKNDAWERRAAREGIDSERGGVLPDVFCSMETWVQLKMRIFGLLTRLVTEMMGEVDTPSPSLFLPEFGWPAQPAPAVSIRSLMIARFLFVPCSFCVLIVASWNETSCISMSSL